MLKSEQRVIWSSFLQGKYVPCTALVALGSLSLMSHLLPLRLALAVKIFSAFRMTMSNDDHDDEEEEDEDDVSVNFKVILVCAHFCC